MKNENDWVSSTLKEVPFWREDMSTEECEIERKYNLQKTHKTQKNKKILAKLAGMW